jgi:hypothetical protein
MVQLVLFDKELIRTEPTPGGNRGGAVHPCAASGVGRSMATAKGMAGGARSCRRCAGEYG